MNKIDTISLSESGKIEKLLGKYFRINEKNNPLMILLWVMLIAYVPLLILSAVEGCLLKGNTDIPFLLDYKAQFRALIAIPLLIVGRKAVKAKLVETGNYIADKLLDDEEYNTVFAPAIVKLKKLNEKGWDELVIVVVLIIYSITLSYYNISQASLTNGNNWFGQVVAGQIQSSTAAKWHLFVSMNIYRFIIVRWIWMYGCWVWILFKISKCKLQLSLHHADKVCGLGLLMLPQRIFNLFFVAFALIASGDLINQILYYNQSFDLVKIEIGIVIGASFIFLLAPYLLFCRALIDAKNRAEIWVARRSAELSKTYQTTFINPTNENETQNEFPSVMADFNSTYETVMNIKPVPFSLQDIIGLAIPIALAFIPTVLTFMTPKELFKIVIGFVV